MKVLYWNIRGVANSPSRLALKRLILVNKPDLVLIAEPWMDANKFPTLWLNRLGLKIFSCNQRENLLPNLWRLCTNNLNPTVLDRDNQQFSFSIMHENKLFCISAVYASNSNLTRKELWNKLTLM